ncbi:hypothetical protein ACFL3F_01770 [Planctomycetota bacterium]
MQAVIDEPQYDTQTATTIYEWSSVSLCRDRREQKLFLHCHVDGETEHLEPISKGDAAYLLLASNAQEAMDLLYEPTG